MCLQDHRDCSKIIVIICYLLTRDSPEQCNCVTFSMFRHRAGAVTGAINSQKGTQVVCAKGFSGQKWSTNSQNNMKESWCFRAEVDLDAIYFSDLQMVSKNPGSSTHLPWSMLAKHGALPSNSRVAILSASQIELPDHKKKKVNTLKKERFKTHWSCLTSSFCR